jgi:hypothetical protein
VHATAGGAIQFLRRDQPKRNPAGLGDGPHLPRTFAMGRVDAHFSHAPGLEGLEDGVDSVYQHLVSEVVSSQ